MSITRYYYPLNETFFTLFHSIKCIERTCRQNMELLQHDLVIAQSMMDAKRKQVNNSCNKYLTVAKKKR